MYARFVSFVAALEAEERKKRAVLTQGSAEAMGGNSGNGGNGGNGGRMLKMVPTEEGVLTPAPTLRMPVEDPCLVEACDRALTLLAASVAY